MGLGQGSNGANPKQGTCSGEAASALAVGSGLGLGLGLGPGLGVGPAKGLQWEEPDALTGCVVGGVERREQRRRDLLRVRFRARARVRGLGLGG